MTEAVNELCLLIDGLYKKLGRPPTQTEVRVARKGGSNSTINAALKLWRSQHRAKALPSYLVEAVVNLHEASMQELANQTKEIEVRADQRIADAEAKRKEIESDAKARAKADRATIRILEQRLTDAGKQVRHAESRYQKEQVVTAALQARVDDRNRQNHALKDELKQVQDRNDDRYTKAMQLLNSPNFALGVPLYASIRADSQFADQNLTAIDRDELPFLVSVVDSASSQCRLQGGPGGQYQIQDVNLYTRISGGRLVCLSADPCLWECPADLGNFTPENPERFEVFRQRGMI